MLANTVALDFPTPSPVVLRPFVPRSFILLTFHPPPQFAWGRVLLHSFHFVRESVGYPTVRGMVGRIRPREEVQQRWGSRIPSCGSEGAAAEPLR
jgi:hypothetical protein